MKTIKRHSFWLVYAVFAAVIIVTRQDQHWLFSNGPYGWGKLLTWLVLVTFLVYTIYCNTKENFFKSLKKMYSFLWFRQIGIDLSLGLVMFGFLIYLNTGSVLAFLIWLVPMTLFGNLATLLYLAVNYDSILSHFL